MSESHPANTYSTLMHDDGTVDPIVLSERDWKMFCADCELNPETGEPLVVEGNSDE